MKKTLIAALLASALPLSMAVAAETTPKSSTMQDKANTVMEKGKEGVDKAKAAATAPNYRADFTNLDRVTDNKLTKEEWVTANQTDATFLQADENKDGVLSFIEFEKISKSGVLSPIKAPN